MVPLSFHENQKHTISMPSPNMVLLWRSVALLVNVATAPADVALDGPSPLDSVQLDGAWHVALMVGTLDDVMVEMVTVVDAGASTDEVAEAETGKEVM